MCKKKKKKLTKCLYLKGTICGLKYLTTECKKTLTAPKWTFFSVNVNDFDLCVVLTGPGGPGGPASPCKHNKTHIIYSVRNKKWIKKPLKGKQSHKMSAFFTFLAASLFPHVWLFNMEVHRALQRLQYRELSSVMRCLSLYSTYS